MTGRVRGLVTVVVTLLLVGGVLGVQLANGGGEFEPLRPADPCQPREVTSRSDGIDGLTERLVLLGIDNAGCTLGISREALTLQLAQAGEPTDAQVDALQDGLKQAVRDMQDDGSLPPTSDLVEETIGNADLNGLLKRLILALPASVVDSALKTDDVLIRTINDLDVREVLSNLDDPRDLNRQIEAAVTQAVKDSLTQRVRDLI